MDQTKRKPSGSVLDSEPVPKRSLGPRDFARRPEIPRKALQKIFSNAKKSAPRETTAQWPKQEEPLLDIEKLPEEWNWTTDEPDLDPNNLAAQVARCRERIELGIMPNFFQMKMLAFEDAVASRFRMTAVEPTGLSSEVITRIQCLRRIERDHENNGDPLQQLPNVRALLGAYRLGELQWSSEGKVTFWSKGKQIGEPRVFDWDDFEKVAREHNGHMGFWVEGINGPGPSKISFSNNRGLNAGDHRFPHVEVELNIAGRKTEGKKTEFIDGTGSTIPVVRKTDVDAVVGNKYAAGQAIPFSMGSESCALYSDELNLNSTSINLDRTFDWIPYHDHGEALVKSERLPAVTQYVTFNTLELDVGVSVVDEATNTATKQHYRRRFAVDDTSRTGQSVRLHNMWKRQLAFNGKVPGGGELVLSQKAYS